MSTPVKENTNVQYGPGGVIVCNGVISPTGAALPFTSPLTFSPDNTQDIGSADAGVTLLRPRSVYVGSTVVVGLTYPLAAPVSAEFANKKGVFKSTLVSVGFGVLSQIIGERFNGTEAAPTAIASGQEITRWGGAGYDGTVVNYGSFIQCTAVENWTVAAHGAALNFNVTPRTTIGSITAWTIDDRGPFVAGTDNTYDIGSPDGGTTPLRPRNIYVATGLQIGGAISAAAAGLNVQVGGATITGAAGSTIASTAASGNVLGVRLTGHANNPGLFISALEAADSVSVRSSGSTGLEDLLFGVGLTDFWKLRGTTGHFCAVADNANDIGSPDGGTTLLAPRKVYAYSAQITADGATGVTSGLCLINQTLGAGGAATGSFPVNVNGVKRNVLFN